jgi:hypothetical protein
MQPKTDIIRQMIADVTMSVVELSPKLFVIDTDTPENPKSKRNKRIRRLWLEGK